MPLRFRVLRRERGQVAMAFIALMGLIVLLTPPLMNLGEVARLKTRTAIAADAGALTGASWAASASNHGARRAQVMQWIWWIVQTIYFVPFCFFTPFLVVAPALAFAANFSINIIAGWTNSYMVALFNQGHNAAFFMTIGNVDVEDRTGTVAAAVEAVRLAIDQGPNNQPLWAAVPFRSPDWIREGLIDEMSWFEVDVQYPPPSQVPQLILNGAQLRFWGWQPWCFIICFPAFGWNEGVSFSLAPLALIPPTLSALSYYTANRMAVAGPGGLAWVGVVSPVWVTISNYFRLPGLCGYPTLLPIWINTGVRRPSSISWATNRVTVRVTRHREPGAQMAWWTMQYPDATSIAVAEYSGAHVRDNPFRAGDRAQVYLVDVQ